MDHVELCNKREEMRADGKAEGTLNAMFVYFSNNGSAFVLFCVAKGCPSIPSPPSGRFVASNGGAVLRLECNPGYIPSGSPMIYCVDRFDWNGTAPVCQG